MTEQPTSQPEAADRGAGPRLKEVGGFELIRKIGQGGMGAVFQARQKSLDRIVALKILPPSVARDAAFIERFQREARASAKLNHPNIVQGIDVGKDEATGLWYFAMELVDGPSLLHVLKEQKVLPEERALEITRDVAKALECAASQGIVHRDVKPDNILLTAQGEPKLADLGLAKQLSSDDPSVTQSGQSVGTPFYMAPEQARGESDQIDVRTDIYALGGTLFHLVTGSPPFSGDTAATIMAKHITEPPPKANRVNPAVSEATTRLITRMMQKKREQRVQTPRELVQQIERILNREDSAGPLRNVRPDTAGPLRVVRQDTTGPKTAIGRAERTPTASPAAQIALGAAAVVLLGVLGVVFLRSSTPKTETAATTPRKEAPPPAGAWNKTEPETATPTTPPPPVEVKAEPAPPQPPPAQPAAPVDQAAARESQARKLWADLQAEEKSGRLSPAEWRARCEQFARNHGQTQAGREAAAQLAALPEPPPEPLRPPALAFSFDRATLSTGEGAVTAADLSGGGRNGLVEGAQTVPGIVGEALHFDGKSNCVVVPVPPPLGPAVTVAAWVRYDVAPTGGWQNTIVCQDNGRTTRVFQLSTLDGKFCWHRFGGGADVVGREKIEAQRWYHVAATYDPLRHEHRLYVDGTLCNQAPGNFTPNPAERICIGRKGTGEPRMFFAGAMDELALWSQALPEARIRELYENGKKAIRPPAGPDTAATQPATQPVAQAPENKATELFVAAFKEAVPILAQNRFADAAALLERKSKEAALADAREPLQQAKADVEAVLELRRQAVEALRGKAGQAVSLKKGGTVLQGKVVDDPKSKGVTLNIGGPELTLSAEQLHAQDVDTYAPHLPAAGDDLRRRGMLFLASGDTKAAKEGFTKARDAGGGPAAEPYLEYLAVLEFGEIEAAAKKAWAAAEALYAQKRLKEAEDAYGAFQQKYSATKTFAQAAETLKQRLTAIAKANKPEIIFVAKDSMKLFAIGYRQMQFPVQETDDATAPFENKAMYFNQKTGTDVVYEVRSPRPLRELRWKGAAMQNMTIEILDAKGNVLTTGGPYQGGNKWAEFTVTFEPRAQFVLRFRNHISTWYLIAELELK